MANRTESPRFCWVSRIRDVPPPSSPVPPLVALVPRSFPALFSCMLHARAPAPPATDGIRGFKNRSGRHTAATDATSHGRRSFLVVMAASWRSRQRPSPLRGGRGGGLCPFVVVTAEVFYTSTQKQRKKSLHMRLPPFSSQEPAWGLRLFAALAPPGDFFGEIIEKKKKKAEKKPPPLAVGGGHVAVFAAPPWRSRRSFADTAGVFSWRSFMVVQFGG